MAGSEPGKAAKPEQGTDEPRAHYGARLFLFLLETNGATGVLEDDDLELAGYAGAQASTAAGYAVTVYDRLSALRHQIAAALRGRQAERDQTAGGAPTGVPGPGRDERPNQGPMAWLEDRPIVRPPGGTHAVPVIDF